MLKLLGESKCFSGRQLRYQHSSKSCQCDMTFSVFLPPQAESKKVPVLYWLSGLTCSDENFVQKSGAQQYAAEQGIAIICPDTSPRGDGVPDDTEGSWDFGLGAGFYVNATQKPWSQHYQMYDYVVKELPELIASHFPQLSDKKSISGHSMGGHGALTVALKNPSSYASVSAFSPVVSPIRCPWGVKALARYLGDDQSQWRQYDASALVEDSARLNDESPSVKIPLLIDQGRGDNFLFDQLKTELLESACAEANHPIDCRYREGYDHSYFYIASFVKEHIEYHAHHLHV